MAESLDRGPPARSNASRRGPLDPAALPRHPGARIALAPELQRWIFRGGVEAARDCGRLFGCELPLTSCRANEAGSKAALWLGPDEWLLLATPGADFTPAEISTDFIRAKIAAPHSLVDMSHRQLGIEVAGVGAARILNTNIAHDLDFYFGAKTGAGFCARTLFGKAEIVLWRKEEQVFHLEVWRSFAGYVLGLLGEACRD